MVVDNVVIEVVMFVKVDDSACTCVGVNDGVCVGVHFAAVYAIVVAIVVGANCHRTSRQNDAYWSGRWPRRECWWSLE